MMRESGEFGRSVAPELISWATHARWAVENDVLYVLDLRHNLYLSVPLSKLRSDAAAIERQLGARGLLRSEGPDFSSRDEPGAGSGTLWSFWRASLWARNVMRRRVLHAATRVLQGAEGDADARAHDLVARYQDWRPLYPRKVSCLFDSLALGRFLWTAGVRSNLIFAVRGGPFSAHAWLEIGATILNDEPGYCAGFVAMRGA